MTDSVRDRALEEAEVRRAICGWLFAYHERDPRQDEDYDVEEDYGQDADSLLKRLRALSSCESVRDRALEEAEMVARYRYKGWTEASGVSCDVTACEDIANAIRALKSAPFISSRDSLRDTLEPFAKEADAWDDIPGVIKTHNDVEIWQNPNRRAKISVGDLRRARDALKSAPFTRKDGTTGEAAPVALGWTCPKCGANIDAAWAFCGVCQTSQQPAQEAPQSLQDILGIDEGASVTMGRFLDAMTIIQRRLDDLDARYRS